MDFHTKIVKVENDFEIDDSNVLDLGIERAEKLENGPEDVVDWCVPSGLSFKDMIVYEDSEEEFSVNTCSICCKMFSDSFSLYRHNLTHLKVMMVPPKRLYQCDHCQSYLTNKMNLSAHIQTKHCTPLENQETPITETVQRCLMCKKTLQYIAWRRHMREAHLGQIYRCDECKVTFKSWTYLCRHTLYSHGNLRPSWRFHTVASEVAFKCSVCPTMFTNKSAYTTHLRNCHTDKEYECAVCHSRLKCKSSLQSHMRRVHYNDGKLYKCNICCKVFRSPRYLGIHKRNTHLVRVKSKEC